MLSVDVDSSRIAVCSVHIASYWESSPVEYLLHFCRIIYKMETWMELNDLIPFTISPIHWQWWKEAICDCISICVFTSAYMYLLAFERNEKSLRIPRSSANKWFEYFVGNTHHHGKLNCNRLRRFVSGRQEDFLTFVFWMVMYLQFTRRIFFNLCCKTHFSVLGV